MEAPDFDPELAGHTAVVLEDGDDESCHAVVSEYPDGERVRITECGLEIDRKPWKLDERGSYVDGEAHMCPECWPEEILS